MRRLFCAVLLLSSLPLWASDHERTIFTFSPVAPTDQSFVVMQVRSLWNDGCLPRSPVVTRSANTVTVRFDARVADRGCPLMITPWTPDVPLGVFQAGTYSVVLEALGDSAVSVLSVRTLVVTEAAPALRIWPRLASIAGGSEIVIAKVCPQTPPTVIVDGITVPSRVENGVSPQGTSCALVATLPPHAEGAVDVRVVTSNGTYDVVNGVHYVDPAAPPDPALYERVLIPVLFNGPGAFGSQWETEAVLTSPASLGLLPDVSRGLAPGVSLTSLFGNHPAGLLLFVPRGSDAQFGNRIRDVSRDASQWGTEIPVVREDDTRQTLVLANVPFDPRYRLQLRVYGMDGLPADFEILDAGGTLLMQDVVRGSCATMPCLAPAYASIDLRQRLPGLSGRQTLTVRQLGSSLPQRLWAFVTVTNNESQHVTVISSQ